MAKRALLIGCNYPRTDYELKGCVNDVQQVRRWLVELFGFDEKDIDVLIDTEDIDVLIDTDGSYTQPTGANILLSIENLIRGAKPGDSLFIHYSGHGMRLPTEDGEVDDTGYDECIVPCDMNLIIDNDFRDFVYEVPDGCRLTIVADCCHSGGLIDRSKEQIGEGYIHNKHHQNGPPEENGDRHGHSERVCVKKRSLRASDLIEILKRKTGKKDIDMRNIRSTLFEMFGDKASPSIKKCMSKLQHSDRDRDIGGDGCGGFICMAWSQLVKNFFLQKPEVIPELETEVYTAGAAANKRPIPPENGILVSGCQTDQESVDGHTTESGSITYGALSYAIQAILAKNPEKISNRRLVESARERMAKQRLEQRPGLYCSDCYVDAPFICS